MTLIQAAPFQKFPRDEQDDTAHNGRRVWRLPAGLLETGVVQSRLAKCNKLATKLGMPALFALVTAPEWIDVSGDRKVQMVELVIMGEAPRVDGFELVARLEHTQHGNLISSHNALPEGTLAAYREAPATCEHCAMNRRRADTFIVRELATGVMKQIGRNCLADFIRSTNAEALVKLWRAIADLTGGFGGSIEDSDGAGWGGHCVPSTLRFLACCCASVRQFGFKNAAQQYSTKVDATFLNGAPPQYDAEARKRWTEGQPTEADTARAAEIIGWADTLAPSSDYDHNLRVSLLCAGVLDKARGIIASAPTAYDRAQGVELKKAQEAAKAKDFSAEIFAPEKKRVRNVAALVLAVRTVEVEGPFGLENRTIVKLQAEREGKLFRLVWWASRNPGVSEGQKITLTGTVKRHETDKRDGAKQTVLNRCVLEAVAAGEVERVAEVA